MTSRPRAEVVVDLDAIRSNVRTLKLRAAGAQMMAVVKADGYGHGMVEVGRAARSAGAEWLGVAVLDEALTLRKAGDTGPILCWLGVPGEDYVAAAENDIEVTAYHGDELAEIVAASEQSGVRVRVQLKVDTGLSRGGCPPEFWGELVREAAVAEQSGTITVTGIWSHFACSDDPPAAVNDEQEAAFRSALAVAHAAGVRPPLRHLANSAAALTRPSATFDLVRCGIALYGLSPVPKVSTASELGLRPAMTVRARIALTKDVAAGSGVSYGHTYRTPANTTLALVPVGYGDGILRSASSVAPVFVGGMRRRIAGRVCMDQFVVDLAGASARSGETVVLFGPGDHGEPTAQEWADACGTISYEIVTGMGGRMRRSFVGNDAESSRDGDPPRRGGHR